MRSSNRIAELSSKNILNTEEAAEYVGIKKRTLEDWRRRSIAKGPCYLNLDGLIRYRRSDLDKYLDSGSQESGDDYK
jgi:hypothetical protein